MTTNILNYKTLNDIKTVLTKNILISNPKRNMMNGNGGGKKFGEEIAKKCIGAGCPSTKPFMQDDNMDASKISVHNNISETPSSASPNVNPTSAQTQTTSTTGNQAKMKEISKPIESIANKVTMNKPLSNSLLNTFPSLSAPIQPQANLNIKEAVETPLQQPKQEISNTKDNSSVTQISNIKKELPSVNDHVVTNSSTKAIMQNVFHELAEKKKEQYEKYGQNDHQNIKPSSVKLKTFSNKEFETSLTPDTQVNDITDPKLIEELKKRELVKEDLGNTAVKIKLSDDSECILGTAKNGIKLSALGQAYHEIQESKDSNKQFPIDSTIQKENIEMMIIVPPQNAEDCFIKTGKQKHLIVGFDTNTDEYVSIGYFTSKISGILISDVQYKSFENKQEKQIMEGIKHEDVGNAKIKEKQQYVVFFDNAHKISSNDIQPVKYSKEYLETFSAESNKNLKEMIKVQFKKPIVSFDIHGLTKNDCLEMCKEFDKIAYAKEKNPKTKLQHPLSSEQEKTNKKNAEKFINKNVTNTNYYNPND